MIKLIQALSGHHIIVDEQDFDEVSKFNWSIGSNGYPKRQFRQKGKNNTVYLHRFLMSPKSDEHIDHADGDKTNASRANLRLCNRCQNLSNQKLSKRNTSGFKGVWLHKHGLWAAEVISKGERVYLKYFKSKEDAAHAYDTAAKLHHGEFARLNFPE